MRPREAAPAHSSRLLSDFLYLSHESDCPSGRGTVTLISQEIGPERSIQVCPAGDVVPGYKIQALGISISFLKLKGGQGDGRLGRVPLATVTLCTQGERD